LRREGLTGVLDHVLGRNFVQRSHIARVRIYPGVVE